MWWIYPCIKQEKPHNFCCDENYVNSKVPLPPCIKRAIITDSSNVMNIVLVFKGPIPPCIKRAITDSSDVMNIVLVFKGHFWCEIYCVSF